MVGNVAKKAVAAALTGAMALSAAAPVALAGYAPTSGANRVKATSTTPTEFAYWDRIGGEDRYGTMKKLVDSMSRSKDWEFKEYKLYEFGTWVPANTTTSTGYWRNVYSLLNECLNYSNNSALRDKYVLVDQALYEDVVYYLNAGSAGSQIVNNMLNKMALESIKETVTFIAYSNAIWNYLNNPTDAAYDAMVAAQNAWVAESAVYGITSQIAEDYFNYVQSSIWGVKDYDGMNYRDWLDAWWTARGNMWTGYGNKQYENLSQFSEADFFPYDVNGGWYVPFALAAQSDLFNPAHVYMYWTKSSGNYDYSGLTNNYTWTNADWARVDGTAKFVTFSLEEVKYDDLWNARAAVLATGDNFPDALSANGLAGSLDIPLILTRTGALSSEAKDLITSHKISKLYVMGGEAAISQAVRDELKKMNVAIIEVAGENRQQTSFEALKLTRTVDQVIVATGKAFADALSIGPLAYRYGIPVVLANNDGTLSEEIADYLKNTSSLKEVIIVGGNEAVSDSVCGQIGMGKKYWRIAGEDRYDTSIKVAQFLVQGSYYSYENGKWTPGYEDVTNYWGTGIDKLNGFSYDSIYVARGDLFPDALAGAQVAAGAKAQKAWETYGAPIVLVKDGGSQVASWLKGYYTIKRDGLYGFYKQQWMWEKTTPGWELDEPTYSYEWSSDGKRIINVQATKYGHVLGGEKAISNKTVDTLNKAVKDAKD